MDSQNLLKAAVIRGPDGKLSDFFKASSIDIYQENLGQWDLILNLPFEPIRAQTPAQVRQEVEKLSFSFDGISMIVGSSFAGIVCEILTRQGIDLYQMEDFVPECLSELAADSLEPIILEIPTSPMPIEPDSGMYEFDMNTALAVYPQLTSKKILIPFLREVPFLELRLFFNHFPPWLKEELANLKLASETVKIGTNLMIRIFQDNLQCT
ncbi:MAG: hypothetical protein LBE31_03895 [Deltaproteobacteria bacterium]|jgi:Fe-only nitrogenase accessory protein AnfO|nr:hypothetical protein [Deltaproteobacteria bacterium]